MRNKVLSKIRRLSQFLMISATLNIFMVALLIYWQLKERPPTPICEKQPTYHKNQNIALENNDLINYFVGLSFKDIVPYLKNKSLIDNGFTLRDLALGCLLTYHDLDLERALPDLDQLSQKRFLNYVNVNKINRQLTVYCGCNDSHFDQIEKFIETEKLPFTSKGLFNRLKSNPTSDKNMHYAFFITPEFMTVELLLRRSDANIEKEEILGLLLEGTWEMLSTFFSKQRISQDLSEASRRLFLLSYIEKGSSKAASIFLKTDSKYALKKLDDAHIIDILKLSKERTPYAARFALDSLISPRNDNVLKEAAYRLYEFVGEEKPKEFNKNLAFSRFICQSKPEQVTLPKENQETFFSSVKPWKRAYTVLEGDSLWKISRMFKVDVQELKKRNHLIKDSLKPGTMIVVP